MSTTPGEPPTTTQSLPIDHGRRWRAFWVCVAVAALTILDISKVNTGLASIENALGGGSTELQLVVSGYILAFGLTLVPFGRIGDQRSRRTLMISGLVGFALASALCALAPTIWMLVVARFLQGVAAGMQMPQVMGTIQQLFRGKERGAAFGLFGATIGLSTAFGPTIGGLLILLGGPEHGWRWIFWMNVPLCAIVMLAAVFLLPELRQPARGKISLDLVGLSLFTVTVVTLMVPFLFTTGSADDVPARWWLLVPCALFLAGFIAWERRYAATGKSPLVPLALFRISSWRNGNLLQTLYFAAMPTIFILTALFLQVGLGLAAVYAGMVTIGFATASAVASWIGGRLVGRYGRALVVWGLTVMLVAVIALALVSHVVSDEVAPWAMAGVLAIGGFGGGFVISPNQTLTLAEIPPRNGGLAGSVGQLGQRIGNAVGAAVGLSMFYSTINRADASSSTSAVYHDAYLSGLMAAAVFLSGALAVALVDLYSRRRAARGDAG